MPSPRSCAREIPQGVEGSESRPNAADLVFAEKADVVARVGAIGAAGHGHVDRAVAYIANDVVRAAFSHVFVGMERAALCGGVGGRLAVREAWRKLLAPEVDHVLRREPTSLPARP